MECILLLARCSVNPVADTRMRQVLRAIEAKEAQLLQSSPPCRSQSQSSSHSRRLEPLPDATIAGIVVSAHGDIRHAIMSLEWAHRHGGAAGSSTRPANNDYDDDED